MNQSVIRQKLLSSGVARLCWPDNNNQTAQFSAKRVPQCDDQVQLVRYPAGSHGQQSRLVVQPPAQGEAGVTLTDEQWQTVCEIADAD